MNQNDNLSNDSKQKFSPLIDLLSDEDLTQLVETSYEFDGAPSDQICAKKIENALNQQLFAERSAPRVKKGFVLWMPLAAALLAGVFYFSSGGKNSSVELNYRSAVKLPVVKLTSEPAENGQMQFVVVADSDGYGSLVVRKGGAVVALHQLHLEAHKKTLLLGEDGRPLRLSLEDGERVCFLTHNTQEELKQLVSGAASFFDNIAADSCYTAVR